MAETLRDSVQVLASSQADWIKSISSARGFFRNAGQPMPPVEVKQLTVSTGGNDDEDEDDDDAFGGSGGDGGDGGNGTPTHWSEQFIPIINQVVMQVLPAINAWSSKRMEDAMNRHAGATTSPPADPRAAEARAAEARATEAKAEEQRVAQAEQEHAAKLAAAIAAASSPGPGIDVLKLLQLLPPRTATKLMQIQMTLSSDEQADAMRILRGYRAEGIEDLLTVFDAASLDECKTFLRGLIVEWRGMQAAKRARAKVPPRDGNDTGGAGSASGANGASGTSGTSGSGSTEP